MTHTLPTSPTRERTEQALLGDLIVDCGHVPFRTELHPPVAIALHLAGTPRTRYSLWAWHRSTLDRDAVDVELWPAVPRPSANAQIKMDVVFDGGIGDGQGKWQCSPAPSDVPNHISCHLSAAPSTNLDSCSKENPRMRPDCASEVAGGLVEVYWQ